MKQIIFPLLAGILAVSIQAQTVDSVITSNLLEPYSVAVDFDNTYYLTDSANHRIIKYVPETGEFRRLAGLEGNPGTADNHGVFARFSSPRGIVLDQNRDGLVVADYNNHTLRLVKRNGEVTTLAGSPGTAGVPSGNVPAAQARFNHPAGLAIDQGGNIYIADTKNNVIRKLDPNNMVSVVITENSQEFFEPAGVAVDDQGRVLVADTRNHTIKRIEEDGTVTLLAGGNSPLKTGYHDSLFKDQALFSNPVSVLFLSPAHGFLVSDSGNHVVRRIYPNPEVNDFSVDTFAGTPTLSGYADGGLQEARFHSPGEIIKDPVGGFLITDQGNHALRRIQTSPPLPPVRDPKIGYVTFVKDEFGELLSRLVPTTHAVFNNDVVIAILAEQGTETYFTYGETPASSLEDTIPFPNRLTGNSPPDYVDGLRPHQVPPSMIPMQPDVLIKAIGTQEGRRPSQLIQSRFQFKAANPNIMGENAAAFVLTNVTQNAVMYYTADGSTPDPVNNIASTRGPVSSGETISLSRSPDPIVFRVRAFRNGYRPSEITTKTFLPEDFDANKITFGFESGEASSKFLAVAGQKFYAPVTLSLLPNQNIYTLQFNMTVNSQENPPDASSLGFDSMLMELFPGALPQTRVIPPAMLTNLVTFEEDIFAPEWSDLISTNLSTRLLAVGWLERFGFPFLFPTLNQDLVSFSQALNNIHESSGGKVIVGGFSFTVPVTPVGSTYEIAINFPSATSDGIARDVLIETPRDGDLGDGLINATKEVRIVQGGTNVNQLHYIVGDIMPFRWFNAGDFGDRELLNNDVVQIFQNVVYGDWPAEFLFFNPPPESSDFWDAMDACCEDQQGTKYDDLVDFHTISPSILDQITHGDGQLAVNDIYVTFQRSLDPSLKWYARYWSNNVRHAVEVPRLFRGAPNLPAESFSMEAAGFGLPPQEPIPGVPFVSFSSTDQVVAPGQQMSIPVRARIIGEHPLRVLMLNVTVQPLEGSPPIAGPVEFIPNPRLGKPTMSASRGGGNFAAAWLNSNVAGLLGDSVVGHLTLSIPANSSPESVYRVHFDHVSSSPNGIGLLPQQVHHALLTAGRDLSRSSWGDSIPDHWRLLHFGTSSTTATHASPWADPDGDGMNNLEEFKAGTNPLDRDSKLKFHSARMRSSGAAREMVLQWFSAPNKSYVVERALDLKSGDWQVVEDGIIGTGNLMELPDSIVLEGVSFYRLRVMD